MRMRIAAKLATQPSPVKLQFGWRLGDVLAAAITLDAIVTLAQAIFFDLPRHSGPLGIAVMVVAVSAPTFAAALQWSGRAHRRVRADG